MKRLLVPMLLLAVSAAAQQLPPAAHQPASDQAASDQLGTDQLAADQIVADQLAFSAASERMTVPVRIAGAGPFPFVIDTGAQRTVIARQLAATLRLPPGRDVRLTAMTGISTVPTVVIASVEVGTLGGRGIEAPALDANNLGAAGLLGIDSLQGHQLLIDFERRVMAVVPARARPARASSADPGEVVVRARSLAGQLVVTDAYCNGVRVRVVLDTGSAVSIGNEALRRRVAKRGRVDDPVVLTGVTGGTLTTAYTAIGKVRLGSAVMERLPIAFADAPPFRQLGLDARPAMLLGMDALQLFRRVEIDFANHQIRLLAPRDAVARRDAEVPPRLDF